MPHGSLITGGGWRQFRHPLASLCWGPQHTCCLQGEEGRTRAREGHPDPPSSALLLPRVLVHRRRGFSRGVGWFEGEQGGQISA